MARKRYTMEQSIAKLREAKIELGKRVHLLLERGQHT